MSRSLRFLCSDLAAAPAEYAVVIALVAASLMLAGQSVQYAANSTFSQTASALGGQAPAAAGSLAPAANVAASGVTSSASSAAFLPFLHGIAWATLFLAAGLVFYSRYRLRRARRQLEELHCGPEPIADDPTNPNFQKRQDIQRVLLKHFDDVLQSRIEVRHVMSRSVRSVAQTVPVADLRELMDREGFHHLLVTKNGMLLGVISDRDIKGRRGWLARHVMTASPLTVTPATPVNQAISMMLHRRISCLPVVETGQVRGILTVTDMLMTLQCLMKLLERSAAVNGPEPSGSPLADLTSELPADVHTAAC
jgi:CBS domain-containing protein/Flp pilus assembly pilin Flp